MKKPRVIFVERKASGAVSVERVFRQIAQDLPSESFDVDFQQVPYGNGIVATLKNLLFFRPKPADIYHITGDVQYISLRLPGKRTVMTILDIISLHQRSGLRRYIIKKLYFDLPFRRLRFMTTISNKVRDEIAAETRVSADSVRVIPNPLIGELIGNDRKPFNAACPVILHIGTAKNKNLDRLIDALAGIDCKLRIVGRLDKAIIRKLELSSIIYENVCELDDVQMKQEYLNADIMAFCSTYEGFGLPIIEAQAMRVPVVTSDLAPMNSVAGDAAVLVDPFDPANIRAGILSVIRDSSLRDDLDRRGLENIKRFEGSAIAAQYAELYRQVSGESNS